MDLKGSALTRGEVLGADVFIAAIRHNFAFCRLRISGIRDPKDCSKTYKTNYDFVIFHFSESDLLAPLPLTPLTIVYLYEITIVLQFKRKGRCRHIHHLGLVETD